MDTGRSVNLRTNLIILYLDLFVETPKIRKELDEIIDTNISKIIVEYLTMDILNECSDEELHMMEAVYLSGPMVL